MRVGSMAVCLVFEMKAAYRSRPNKRGAFMNSGTLQGVAFFALAAIILVAIFGGFGAL